MKALMRKDPCLAMVQAMLAEAVSIADNDGTYSNYQSAAVVQAAKKAVDAVLAPPEQVDVPEPFNPFKRDEIPDPPVGVPVAAPPENANTSGDDPDTL